MLEPYKIWRFFDEYYSNEDSNTHDMNKIKLFYVSDSGSNNVLLMEATKLISDKSNL